MVHVDLTNPQPCVKQVEFNTIASSFGGLSSMVSGLHSHLLDIDAYPDTMTSMISRSSLPHSTSVPGLVRGMADAHEAYGSSSIGLPTCVIFLVQDVERNVFDQRHLEYALNERHGVRTFRLPFGRVLTDTKVDSERRLIYSPPHKPTKKYEVTLIYLRAGYSPTEYADQTAWDARLHLERSAATKCPSVLLQLAGTKKVQSPSVTWKQHSPAPASSS
jgi:glutathione synthase